jgi:hypothetical protein
LLVVFALSAAGAIYLVLELGQPFAGSMQISSAPLRNALVAINPWSIAFPHDHGCDCSSR